MREKVIFPLDSMRRGELRTCKPAITVSESVFRTYTNKNEIRLRKLEIFQNINSSSTNTKPQINIINHTCSPLIFLYSLLQNYESSILISCSWHMSYEQRITHKNNKTSKMSFNTMIIVPIAFSNIYYFCITRMELHSAFKMLLNKENTAITQKDLRSKHT